MNTKISEALNSLLLQQPFYSSLYLSFDIKESDTIPTCATDGLHVLYNKNWIDTLTREEICGVILHEILHIVYMHCNRNRIGARDHKIWNIAADYVINSEILDDLNMVLPDNGLYDSKYHDWLVEDVYKNLFDNYSKCPNNRNFDVHIIGKGTQTQEAKHQIEVAVLRAAESSKQSGYGSLSTNMKRLLNKLHKPSVP